LETRTQNGASRNSLSERLRPRLGVSPRHADVSMPEDDLHAVCTDIWSQI